MKPGSIVAAGLAVCAGVLGFWGFNSVEPGCDTDRFLDCFAHYTNTLWKTLALFVFEADITETNENTLTLVVARILAPAATGIALYTLVSTHIALLWTLFRLRRMRGHTIVIGDGRVGRSFVDGCKAGEAVAVIDLAGATKKVDVARSGTNRTVRFLRGDARDRAVLQSAAAGHAARVFIVAGDDTVNLEILRTLLALPPPRWFSPSDPVDVLICIEQQSLVRQLDRDDHFARHAGASDTRAAAVTPFSPDRLAAQRFIAENPLVDLADLRAQRNLHLVVVGWSDFTFEVLELIARLSPYRDFSSPRVDLFAHQPEAVRAQLAVLQPTFLDGIEAPLIDLRIHDLDNASSIPTMTQMRAVEPDGRSSVSAILVSLASDETTAAVAVAIRERCTIDGRWAGPVFAKLGFDSALSDYLEDFADSIDQSDMIVPIGDVGRSCKLDAIRGAREDMAKALHRAYVAHQRAQAGASEVRGENLQPWADLRQTFRISNRRAADHIPIKLLSADYVFVPGNGLALPAEDDFAVDVNELETLAALEHRSWEIGRRLDGWKSGSTRDDKRRINPALDIPYADLGEPVKELDRVQVRTVASALKGRDDGEVALRDFPIGLIGHNRVSADEKARIVEALRARLTTLLANQPKRHYSLLTPLAPGSDTILTEEALRLFDECDVPHRLVVVRTLPRDAMIADFVNTLADGSEWRLAPRSDDPTSSQPAAMLSGHLDSVMTTADRTIVANLVPTGLELGDWLSDKQHRQDAYRRANAYIANRCRLIMAFRDRTRLSRPGGTGEALSWARGDAVPTAFRDVVRDRQAPAPQVIELTDTNTAATPSQPTDSALEQAASND